jgi:hypothetical protein
MGSHSGLLDRLGAGSRGGNPSSIEADDRRREQSDDQTDRVGFCPLEDLIECHDFIPFNQVDYRDRCGPALRPGANSNPDFLQCALKELK